MRERVFREFPRSILNTIRQGHPMSIHHPFVYKLFLRQYVSYLHSNLGSVVFSLILMQSPVLRSSPFRGWINRLQNSCININQVRRTTLGRSQPYYFGVLDENCDNVEKSRKAYISPNKPVESFLASEEYSSVRD